MPASHNFRVQVFVARGRSEWFVRVAVSVGVLVGLTPAVIVAAPEPAWPSIPMTGCESQWIEDEYSKNKTRQDKT